MVDTAYDGDLGLPISFVFTPSTGTPFGTEEAQGQELTPADMKVETAKLTPISGANAGDEQFILTKIPVGTIPVKATYSKTAHAAAQTCLTAKVTGVMVITYGDGSTDTFAKAALTGLKGSTINANDTRTDDLEFTVALPPVFAAGA
jgi:hypothetical protein